MPLELRRAAVFVFAAAWVPIACTLVDERREDPTTGRTQQAVVNGSPDTTHNLVVALTVTGGTTSRCSGTIVRNEGGVGTILTAAHCFSAATTGVAILLGPNVTTPTSTFTATAWSTYPGAFDEEHDLAVVTFAAPGALGTMPLVPPADYLAYSTSASFLAVGYGKTQPDAAPTLPSVSTRNRISLPFRRIYGTGIDTQSGVGAICQGDSGGALIDTSGGTERLVGVNVSGSACAANATNHAIGFYAPEITAWLRTKGLAMTDALQPDGADCTTDAVCNSTACIHYRVNGGASPDVDHCGAPSDNNTSCTRNAQCASRFCATTVCAACRNADDCDGGTCASGKCPAPPRPPLPEAGTDGGTPAGDAAPSEPPGAGASSGEPPTTTTAGDAGTSTAVTSTPPPPAEDEGCQTSGSGASGPASGSLLAVLVGLALGRRRRRRVRSSSS